MRLRSILKFPVFATGGICTAVYQLDDTTIRYLRNFMMEYLVYPATLTISELSKHKEEKYRGVK